MTFDESVEATRRRLRKPWTFRFYLWTHLPLAACAGLRLVQNDHERCIVALPGGWRTQNPFRSTYFAAQAMAAEMSTGAPAMALVSGAPGSVSLLVREVRGVFSKKIVGGSRFTFSDVAAMREAIMRAAAGGEGETFVATSTGCTLDGTVAAQFEITWSFKRRG